MATGHIIGVEVVVVGVAGLDKTGDDIPAHVVAAVCILGVFAQRVDQGFGSEDVVAHRGEQLLTPGGETDRVGRLLYETGNLGALARLQYAEATSLGGRDADRSHRGRRAGVDVLGEHLERVHPVDMVGPKDQDVLRPLVVHDVEVLVDGIGRAGEPPRAAPHLGGYWRHVAA